MTVTLPSRIAAALCGLVLVTLALHATQTQQPPPQFGGAYASLDARRQRLIDGWVARFNSVTKQSVAAGAFYDDILKLSTKTTFDAVTHALITTPLTDRSGGSLGDALDLIEQVETVKGETAGASGDRQFRLYVRLREGSLDRLARSQQFDRGMDNAVYHKGYPINYRQRGGVPSIQVSVAQDGRRADIDVDYRSAAFPVSMFNGHLSAANSDVRAGSNPDRHAARWTGFQSWWRGFFGIRVSRGSSEEASAEVPGARLPRAGKKNIDVMMNDFLTAWLIEGDAMAAINYVSPRAYACLAEDTDDPSSFDRGMAPFQLLIALRTAKEALGPRTSLDGLVVGVRLAMPELKVVTQPHHARFVLYAVPDDVAARFDCAGRQTPGSARNAGRRYGNYFGATFHINGQKDHTMALLWAQEDGYWKIVSWQAEADEDRAPAAPAAPEVAVARINGDPAFVAAARGFLEDWLIRKDYDRAFRALSVRSYACYDLERGPTQPPAASPEDAGRRIRAGLESVGQQVGRQRSLDAVLESVAPSHPAIRLMDHPASGTFTLAGLPTVFGQATDCAARARGDRFAGEVPLEYGQVNGTIFRLRTHGGEAPVMRLVWAMENGAWRITAYAVELP